MDCFALLAMTAWQSVPLSLVITREGDDPVFQMRLRMDREAAAYWIARSSRTMTAVKIESVIKKLSSSRP
jgi:hypothetical protein